jgi:5'-deoxynucleotidase YfbR-like HD superfamily hydrolase
MNFVEAWKSGQVTRKHTMENIRAENIAEHTWGVTFLLMLAWPNVPMRIVKMAMVHDNGERATGDMPGPTKWANPEMEAIMDRLEKEHMVDTLPKHVVDLHRDMTDTDWAVIEIFDRAEFCVSMIRERMLGNRYSEIYYKRGWDKMSQTWEEHRDDFRAKDPALLEGIIAMRRDIAQNWEEAKIS